MIIIFFSKFLLSGILILSGEILNNRNEKLFAFWPEIALSVSNSCRVFHQKLKSRTKFTSGVGPFMELIDCMLTLVSKF